MVLILHFKLSFSVPKTENEYSISHRLRWVTLFDKSLPDLTVKGCADKNCYGLERLPNFDYIL